MENYDVVKRKKKIKKKKKTKQIGKYYIVLDIKIK